MTPVRFAEISAIEAYTLKGTNTQHNELMLEIYSKGLVRAVGKVLLMNFS